LTAQLTRCLEEKSSQSKQDIPGKVTSNLSQSKPALMNMATKTRGKAHECKLSDKLSAYQHEQTRTGVKPHT